MIISPLATFLLAAMANPPLSGGFFVGRSPASAIVRVRVFDTAVRPPDLSARVLIMHVPDQFPKLVDFRPAAFGVQNALAPQYGYSGCQRANSGTDTRKCRKNDVRINIHN